MIHRYTYRQTIHTHEIYIIYIFYIYVISNICAHTYNIYASLKSLKTLKKVQGASVGSCLSGEGTGSEGVGRSVCGLGDE